MRTLGYFLLVFGVMLFLGNVSARLPSVPGLGVGMAVVGYLLTRISPDHMFHSTAEEEWR